MMIKKSALKQPALKLFYLLAAGTLPTLFINPLHYLLGLVFCLFISFAIIKIIL